MLSLRELLVADAYLKYRGTRWASRCRDQLKKPEALRSVAHQRLGASRYRVKMLISFIGAPCSGKTTTAALVFADLKDAGRAVEFIPEQARFYIAEMRERMLDLGYGYPPRLDDRNQMDIFDRQRRAEEMFCRVSSESITLSDSSPLNSLLYLGEENRQSPQLLERVRTYLKKLQPLIFHTPPVPESGFYDANRIHNHEESQTIASRLIENLLPFLQDICEPITLVGDSAHHRATQALAVIWSRLGVVRS